MTAFEKARALALIAPAGLLAGALGSQYLGGLFPCEMCHWQRWPHYAAVVAALAAFAVGDARRGRALVILAALLILASGAIGLFHAGVEYGWWQGLTRCSAIAAQGSSADILREIMATPMIRCDEAQWTLFGVSLAGFNAILSAAAGIGDLGAMPETHPMSPRRPAADVAAMIRVDQAGEYGATRIYAGQLAVMGDRSPAAALIAGMAAQEAAHRAKFDALLAERGVRPTLLQPLWNVAGFALGAATALLGPEAAMACTAAVETEIDRHYADQLVELGDAEPELAATIAEFQAEELEHLETALHQGAERAPGYALLSGVIRLGCRVAIAASKRI